MTTWQRWSASDIGNRRALNEDALVLRDEDGLWAVIDGLGGADVGNVASAAFSHALEHMELAAGLPQAVDQIEDIMLAVHEQLKSFSAAQQPARLLGCTCALLRMTASWSLLAWVGDVRVYRWRGERMEQLTADHVQGQPPELTRLIGADDMLPDFALLAVQPGDRYLICSDGLHAELGDERLAWWLARDPLKAQRELVAEALAAGGHDNLSLIIIEVDHD